MKITVTVRIGREFGDSGEWVTEKKVFTNTVDFQRYRAMLAEFDALGEIESVAWDCRN